MGDPGGLVPTDQYSPAVPGFRDVEIYPLDGPDLAAAKRLTGPARNGGAVHVRQLTLSEQAEILRTNLRAIGISLEVRQFPLALLQEKQAPDAAFDIGRFAWIPDYPDPANVLGTLFHGGSAWYPGGFAIRTGIIAGLALQQTFVVPSGTDVRSSRRRARALRSSCRGRQLPRPVRHLLESGRMPARAPRLWIDLAALCLRRVTSVLTSGRFV